MWKTIGAKRLTLLRFLNKIHYLMITTNNYTLPIVQISNYVTILESLFEEIPREWRGKELDTQCCIFGRTKSILRDFQFPVHHVTSLKSHRSIVTSKKPNKQKSQLLLDPFEKWGHKANCCPKNWRERQKDKENHSLPEQRSLKKNFCGNQCWRREPRTVTEELLEAQGGQPES